LGHSPYSGIAIGRLRGFTFCGIRVGLRASSPGADELLLPCVLLGERALSEFGDDGGQEEIAQEEVEENDDGVEENL
jgi:hypothetical protein